MQHKFFSQDPLKPAPRPAAEAAPAALPFQKGSTLLQQASRRGALTADHTVRFQLEIHLAPGASGDDGFGV